MSTAAPATKPITFYTAAEAPSLDHDGIMMPPVVDPTVLEAFDFTPLADGAKVTVLFKGDGADGMSLVHAWFGPGYRLPRHSHSADCLYYVISGEAILGSQSVKAGSGFFVPKDGLYGYRAGPEGVEILEFRHATSFDMIIPDDKPERWQPIVDAATKNQDLWKTTRPS